MSAATDFIENFGFQPGHEVFSKIDGLPVGSLIWNDAAYAAYNPEMEFALVMDAYAGATSVTEQPAPEAFSLSQNFSNPFDPTTTIGYTLPAQTFVSLKLFTVLGQEVATLVETTQSAGRHSVELNGSTLSSGVNFYRLKAGSFAETRKMIEVK